MEDAPLSRNEIFPLLRRSALFRALDDEGLNALASRAHAVEFETGQFLLRRGDRGEAMIVVVEGHVKIVMTSDRGAELLITIIESGGILGELALLDGGERSADAIALDHVKAIKLPRSAFLNFLERHPRASIRLLALLSMKLRHTTELAEDAAFLDLPVRLYRRLLSLAKLYGVQTDKGLLVAHKMPQKDLASSIGASRESVNKQLRAWFALGLIETGSGYTLIKNPQALEREVAQ